MKWYEKIATKMIKNSLQSEGYQTMDLNFLLGKTFWGIENSTIETNEAIYSAITRLSNTMASLPLKLKQDHQNVNNDLSDRLLFNPHGALTIYDLINRFETVRNETGNVYAVIERDIYLQFQRFHILNSHRTEIAIHEDTGEEWYITRDEKGNQHFFHHMDVLHLKGTVKNGGHKGISPIKVLENATQFDKSVREFSLREMEKPESFVLKYGVNVDENKRKKIVQNFKAFYRDNGGVLFQEPGVEIEPMDNKYVSAETVAAEQLSRERVANVFQMPPIFLGVESGIKFSKNEDINRFYVQHTMLPIIRQYEMELNRKTLTLEDRKAGLEWKFNVRGLLRGDTVAQMQAYSIGIRNGVYKPNEPRGWDDLPPEEGGDQLLISGDLYPIEMSPEERNPSRSGSNNAQPSSTEEETE